jgi:hypothetical protein
MGERANRLEAQCHSDRFGVYAAGVWEESHAPYPERSVVLPMAKPVARRTEGTAEVSRGHSSRSASLGERPTYSPTKGRTD